MKGPGNFPALFVPAAPREFRGGGIGDVGPQITDYAL
jgi:hypothetical protein